MRAGRPWTASQTWAGVSGMSAWRTPKGARASITAFTTAAAAGEPTVADSPTPLQPNGWWGDGVTVMCVPSADTPGPSLRCSRAPLRVFPSEMAAWVAAAEYQGLSVAVHHLVAPELTRGVLVPVPVAGTPADLFWYVSTLSPDRRSPAASRLRRFLATPEAMQVMARPDGSVPASRLRPPVYVTLWS